MSMKLQIGSIRVFKREAHLEQLTEDMTSVTTEITRVSIGTIAEITGVGERFVVIKLLRTGEQFKLTYRELRHFTEYHKFSTVHKDKLTVDDMEVYAECRLVCTNGLLEICLSLLCYNVVGLALAVALDEGFQMGKVVATVTFGLFGLFLTYTGLLDLFSIRKSRKELKRIIRG